ncbi:MAG: GHKL domain-containing protein [Oscillospiraceae bacterium]|nr:GHKL domain-containing protein [Oscillospiraceae bacterium]
MDYIMVGYSLILNGLRFVIEIDFLTRFFRIKIKPSIYLLYLAICSAANLVMTYLQMPLWVQFCIQFSILLLIGMKLLNKRTIAVVAPCVIVATLITLIDGFTASTLQLLIYVIPIRSVWWMVTPFVPYVVLLMAGHKFLKYIAVRNQRYTNDYATSYLPFLLLPCLLTITVIHFDWGLWDTVVTVDSSGFITEDAKVARGILVLLFAFLSFIAALIAFFKLVESAERDAEKVNLEHQIKSQQQYVAEAKQRSEQYRSFYHDINNHYSVLSGLISTGNNLEATEYLQKIKSSADEAVGTISTGNVVLDVLLGEKLSFANRQGIEITCDMQLDKNLGVDDFDLCILFANAMDNAIHACINCADKSTDIHITSKTKNDFLFVEVENTCIPNRQIVWGVGLKNMKHTAEKYRGTIKTEVNGCRFRLSILLCLPTNRNPLNHSRN